MILLFHQYLIPLKISGKSVSLVPLGVQRDLDIDFEDDLLQVTFDMQDDRMHDPHIHYGGNDIHEI